MRVTHQLREATSRTLDTARALSEIAQIARLPDHRRAPVARKPTYRRFLDLAYISLRWGEVSSGYYAQDTDRVGRRVRDHYMPYPVFRSIRDSRNRSRGTGEPFDYICLLQDKRLFERYFAVAGLPVMSTVCEISPERGLEFDGRSGRSFRELGETLGTPVSLFCKPRFGIHGHDAFRLDLAEDGVFVDGESTDTDALARRIREPCICQRRILQHPDLARLHPESVNTLRIVTFRDGHKPEVLFASLKLGADGHVTDNGGDHRCIVRVDTGTGQCYETGYWKQATHSFEEVTCHCQTGVRFCDCSVPRYDECVDLACRAHDWLPGIYSVGWDLAVTPDGPVLLEGNDDWSGSTTMSYADVRERFLRIHDLEAPAAAQASAEP